MMATAPMASGPKKLSFAKVAASGAKENVSPAHAVRVAVPKVEHPAALSCGTPSAMKNAPAITTIKPVSPIATAKPALVDAVDEKTPKNQKPAELVDTKTIRAMKDLSLSSNAASNSSTPSLVVNGSSSSVGGSQSKNDTATAVSDDVSQRADSLSETGTKPPSLDGKSITSGTTFALDEKESLRPDDSASVKAAVEDDEAFSVRGLQVANSRMGSEVARVHHLRIGDMPERKIIHMVTEPHDHGIVTPQSGSSGPAATPDRPPVLAPGAGTPEAFNSTYARGPDEKLLEAMSSPKDRLFLLRLEQEVVSFVLNSKEPYMDLPPNNSFCRMLTHKLADYYHMTHSFEVTSGSVRIFRTPFCRVPPSLASIVGTNAEEHPSNTPPVLLPKKIMRRGEDGGSGQASTSPSKATSEVGSDGKGKTPAKEKPTREQREEAYNKARERIFGSSEKTGESTPDTEDANGVSRASSVSTRDRSHLGKRGKTGKQRRDDSESFDSRSQYQPVYSSNPQQPYWAPQYVPNGSIQYNQVQQPYPNAMPQMYPQPNPAYPQMMGQPPMGGYPPYGTMPQYPPQPAQPTQPRYPPAPGPMPVYGSPMQPAPPQPSWQQPTYNQSPSPVPGPYQQTPRGPQPQGNMQPMGIPYAYGQLPANANPNDPKSQHPIPGSYQRHAFNPKTQSFVPGNGMNAAQPPMGPYPMGGPQGSPQINSPPMAYTTYSSPAPPPPYMGGPPGYGMSRQSSNNSLPAYHHVTPPQHMPQQFQQMPPQMGTQMPQPLPHHLQNKGPQQPMNGGLQQPPQTYTSLPNYGNPATLPQKPPTGI